MNELGRGQALRVEYEQLSNLTQVGSNEESEEKTDQLSARTRKILVYLPLVIGATVSISSIMLAAFAPFGLGMILVLIGLFVVVTKG